MITVSLYHEVPIILTPGQTSGTITVNIPFTAGYLAVHNTTPATLTVGNGTMSGPITTGGITVYANKSYTGQMQPTQTVTVNWTSQTQMTSAGNQAMMSFSDQPIHLTVADNAAQTVIGMKLNEDPNSGTFPAYATAQEITFLNQINYFEFWNFDTSGKDLWINFLQPPTGHGGPGDIKIPADPNGGGQGGYYSCPANYSSVWVMGGAGQVVGWYINNA